MKLNDKMLYKLAVMEMPMEGKAPVNKLFVVRLFDGFDNIWIDVTESVSREEAERIWNDRTKNGTKNINFDEIDYYKIFEADTKMVWS